MTLWLRCGVPSMAMSWIQPKAMRLFGSWMPAEPSLNSQLSSFLPFQPMPAGMLPESLRVSGMAAQTLQPDCEMITPCPLWILGDVSSRAPELLPSAASHSRLVYIRPRRKVVAESGNPSLCDAAAFDAVPLSPWLFPPPGRDQGWVKERK